MPASFTVRTRSLTHLLIAVLLAAALLPAVRPGVAAAASLTEVTGFGSNPGNLRMFEYVPDGLPSGAPVVVLLHGCSQQAAAYDAETGWVKFAEQWGFTLVLPQQQSGNNSSSCFNWFESGDIARGSGEALSIKQMVDRSLTNHGGDAARVFVSGLSAGGAMVAVMLATYPDVFAGGAIVAGVPYRCGLGVSNAFSCMNPGKDRTPTAWGNEVRAASSHTGPWPKVTIWHGTSDTTVRPVNAAESVEQWTNVHGIDQVPDIEDTVAGFPHEVHTDASGNPVVERYIITGMGHGTPVDPGAGAEQCGTAGAFILDVDVCSTYYTAKFWGLDDSDGVPPTVTLTAPSDAATVSGSTAITATASDDTAVDRVEFLVDGIVVGTDTTSPYSTTWDASTAANGTHAITARAVDTAGNSATSSTHTVTVTGGVSDTTAPTATLTYPTAGATVTGTVTLSAGATDDTGVTSVEFLVDGASVGEAAMAGQAGAWQLSWNSTTVSDGTHTVSARATDAAGNVGTSASATITVDQSAAAFIETFSDLDSDGDAPDTSWSLGGFVEHADDHTSGPVGSKSIRGYATSGSGCIGGWKTTTTSHSVALGAEPELAYARRLDLRAQVNMSTTARFRALVNGTVVDELAVTYATHTDAGWVERSGIDLSAWANTSPTLTFEVAANSNVCLAVTAEALIDDVRVAAGQASPDTTAPTVNVTAPANAASVSGTVDVTATASDDTAVAKVEFFVDGDLIGVDTGAPFAVSWDTTTAVDGSHTLMAKAYDAAGNVGTDNDTTVTVANGGGGGGPTTVTFDNLDSEDGYLKANSDGSGASVGGYESWYGLAVGRGSDGKHNRAVLSFDTSSIPDTAVVSSAYLTITYRSGSGDPWSNPAGSQMVIDLANGCFGACTIAASDWGATPSAAAVASIVAFSSGTQASSLFDGAGRANVNRTGRTQARLRFSAFAASTAYRFIDNGVGASLTVTYQ